MRERENKIGSILLVKESKSDIKKKREKEREWDIYFIVYRDF